MTARRTDASLALPNKALQSDERVGRCATISRSPLNARSLGS